MYIQGGAVLHPPNEIYRAVLMYQQDCRAAVLPSYRWSTITNLLGHRKSGMIYGKVQRSETVTTIILKYPFDF